MKSTKDLSLKYVPAINYVVKQYLNCEQAGTNFFIFEINQIKLLFEK
jgi:hypothetical protein